jgi:hypothetical protein
MNLTYDDLIGCPEVSKAKRLQGYMASHGYAQITTESYCIQEEKGEDVVANNA